MSFNDMKSSGKNKKNKIYKNVRDNKRYKSEISTYKFMQENNLICEEMENHNIMNDIYKLNYLSNIGELIIEQYDNKPSICEIEDKTIFNCDTSDSENKNQILEQNKQQTIIKESCSDNILDYLDKPFEKKSKKNVKINKYNFIINNCKVENESSVCPNCQQSICQIIVDNKLICKFCGFSKNETLFCSPENNEVNKKITYPYKRLNHLKECLNQLQAKESINIPFDVKEKIINEIKKRKLDVENVKYEDVKNIIKYLKYNKYYDHYIYITVLITGKQPLTLKKHEEKDIIIMFQNILTTYESLETKTRVNFLNYYYVLHKIFELKNNQDFIKYCPLLKSNDKLIQQDMIWKQICKKLNWKYIPSI